MIVNIDSANNRFYKLIGTVFLHKDNDTFFSKMFSYINNPSYETESAFLYQLTYEVSTQGDWSSIYMFDTGSIPTDEAVIKKLSDSNSPKLGFSDMLVLRIKTEYATYYTKFWEEDRKKRERMFRAYIKNNYELGIIDDYIGKFEKIK